jgi:hypothetical protein
LARIEPLIGAQRYSEKDLREGRIIAKLSMPESEKEGYPKYGLTPGQATYWWVQTDESGTAGKSIFLTAMKDGRVGQVPRPLTRVRYDDSRYKGDSGYKGKDPEYEGRKWQRAVARWIWSLLDETAKGPCGAAKCS